ncbi:hypothetical protein CWI69_08340 [Pseudidiomarina halophila]|uniref:Uncharacterized protein n=1 Tax=Pseudidiomarina halophila TaxID=1449799 RepID=A0A432XWN3_9GAMM|nr:hypothetical protein [Pseudidiomarina halophila]RUO53024.1 hypothetical protein CWI69_08340 [Pseudidiomarina halophila]
MILFDISGIKEITDNSFSALLGLRRSLHVGEYHAELVAANPGKQVMFAQRLADLLGDMHQQGIAHILAEGIVDIAQVIKIKHHQRESMLLTAVTDTLLQLLLKVIAVSQTCQRVEARLITDGMHGPAQALLGEN